MRFMAGTAAFQPHGSVFKGEGPALIGMTPQASGFIRGEHRELLRPEGTVWIMTIDTGHGALRKPVSVRSLKLRPRADMATGTLRVQRRRFSGPKCIRSSVNTVAAGTGHLSLAMPALQTAGMGGLIQVARHADLIGLPGAQFGRIADVLRRS